MTRNESKVRRNVIDKLNKAIIALDNLHTYCEKKDQDEAMVASFVEVTDTLTEIMINLTDELEAIESD